MAFKIRDLMIDIVPQRGFDCGCPTNRGTYPDVCYFPSACICTIFWPRTGPPPPPRTYTPPGCGITQDPRTPILTGQTPAIAPQGMAANPESLAELKAQLRQTLARVEAQERVMEDSMKPQTVAETEALEQKLQEALEALRKHREELQGR